MRIKQGLLDGLIQLPKDLPVYYIVFLVQAHQQMYKSDFDLPVYYITFLVQAHQRMYKSDFEGLTFPNNQ